MGRQTNNKGGLTKSFLVGLLNGGLILLALSSPSAKRLSILKILEYGLEKRRQKQKFFWTLAYLRRKKYIEYKEQEDGTIKIVLTENGKRIALRYNLDTISLNKNQKWDGKWRIVAFDIPESKKAARDALTQKMNRLRMVQLQKSVWVWPYDCRNEIDFIAEVFGVGKYVHHIIAESITSDKFLTYKFNLG